MRLNLKDIVLQSKLEMAKTLYANGVSLYYISMATGLSWCVLMTELTFIASHEIIRQKADARNPEIK
ncbi:glycine cleavage system protein T [Citrobacter portucalensis]|nr:glycine cleavage system protein T [Citrobacter portucalensis]